MKKGLIALTLLIFSVSFISHAGDDGDMKNFRFGVMALPSLNWYKPDNLKKYSNDGSVFRFGILINGEYSFSGNFALGFGLGLTGGGGKIDFTGASGTDTVHYYYDDESGSVAIDDVAGGNAKWEHFKLVNRTYRASYYLVPISLKMRTNEIGYMRYFFEPRLNIGIRNKVRANDNVVSLKSGGQSSTQSDLDITKDMALMRLSVTLSGGGEYYLSGSTAITFAIGYDYGLTNVAQKNSEHLMKTPYDSGGSSKPIEQKFTQSGIVLSVGILF